MKQALKLVLDEITSELQQLPPEPSADAKMELFRRLRSLSESMQYAVQGRDDVAFFRAADSHYRTFRKSVLQARPTVRLPGSGAPAAADNQEQAATASSGAASTEDSVSVLEVQEESLEFWLAPEEPAATEDGEVCAAADGAAHQQQQLLGPITLERVCDLTESFKTHELPELFPFRVVQELVQGSKGRWDAAAQACLHDVAGELRSTTSSLVQQQFRQFPAAEIHVRDLLYEELQLLVEDTKQRLEHLMAMESEETWTQNDHYYVESMQRFLDMLTKRMYGSSSAADDTTLQSNIRGALSYLAALQINKEDLELLATKKKEKAEGQEGLLKLVAGTLAYYKVASKRVIDGVPMHLKHYLLQRYCRAPDELLVKRAAAATKIKAEAGVAESAEGTQQQLMTAEQLLAEDASTADLRANLMRQLEQLQNVRKLLEAF